MNNSLTLKSLLQTYPPAIEQQPLCTEKRKVCQHISACRTAAMGGLKLHCDQCGYATQQYHSCRDRHCPQCQYRQRQSWCEQQQANVLPVTYYHVVFTLPHELNGWIQLHPREIYGLLFSSVWKTLKTFAENPRHLGGQPGMTAMLHTWGQNLSQHVHLHCLIPGGAIDPQNCWHPAKSNYLFPVRALSKVFRGKMVSALRATHEKDDLKRITRANEINQTLNTLMEKDWVVYSRACLTKTETIIDYLGRYSHRIALSDSRLAGIEAGKVLLKYKDYRDNKHKIMLLKPEELIRRFLLHVLPKGLMRIRHYGFMANCVRKKRLESIRRILEKKDPTADQKNQSQHQEKDHRLQKPSLTETQPCPNCKSGQLKVTGELPCLLIPSR